MPPTVHPNPQNAALPLLPRSAPTLRIRDPQNRTQQTQQIRLSPTTLGFVLPLFIVFIFGPLILVYTIKHSRRERVRLIALEASREASAKTKVPEIGREEARIRLAGATEVVKGEEGKEVYRYEFKGTEVEGEKDGVVETESVMGDDCAICLCSLHAPAPPAPAKVASETSVGLETNESSSVKERSTRVPEVVGKSLSEQEVILRLRVCGHEFHAECLVSWCALGKVNCPICRAVYFEKEGKGQKSDGESSGSETDVETGGVSDTSRRTETA
ncbi:hypothetical protein CC80DRAFT_498953 [Byssothecium circinans]|uniref:RING-type domain-containing protein n=1 Tax=Byssothecium circinans TaxID=147558 RepID=A0A6A5UGE1_9PLEO|nr:hypothetical protein CC80DRAFT_498953 [Byssothecium circinans]